ncbi:MAG: ROK family protein [Clostridia bacterium]|nr:ROK family protein [Clostridia bacterium]
MRIGIDIGGSHIGVGLVDSNGNIVKLQEKYIKEKKVNSTAEFIAQEIVTILTTWKNEEKIVFSKIGIGAPGIVRNNEVISSVNLGLNNFKIEEEIKKYFPTAQIKVANDAKCAALAEKRWGSLKEYEDCIFLCLGTGIGGAAFYNGRLIKPERCAGFEFGHMIIEKNGRLCNCGSNGCYEQYGSMRKFKSVIKERMGIDKSIDGGELRSIIRNNIDTDVVKNTIEEYIKYVCIGLTNLVNILEPQVICLGGGFVKYKDILLNKLVNEFRNSKNLFYKENIPEIVIANFGNDAGIIGSTLLFD